MAAIRGILVELDGPHAGRRIALPDRLTIGGAPDGSGGWEGGALVERKGPGRFVVRELDPRSPVLVNEDRIATAPLDDGAFLNVGRHAYRFFLEAAAAAPPRASPPGDSPGPRPIRCSACHTSVARALAVRRRGRPYCPGCAADLKKDLPAGVLVGISLTVIAAGALIAWVASSRTDEDTSEARHPAGPGHVSAAAEPASPPALAASLSTADLVASVEGGVALISGPRGVGTGFLVADGILATNAHVIEDTFLPDLRVTFPARSPQKSRVLAILHKDNRRDLCLLRVARGPPPLTLAERVPFRRGEQVLLIGNPGVGDEIVLENAVTQGLMSSLTTIKGERFMQISASVNPGNSGGPILNEHGEVLAVATLKAGGVEGIAFGIPATDVSRALVKARRASDGDARSAEAAHHAEVVFLRLANIGTAYIRGMYIHVEAMQDAIDEDRDPSLALWVAQAACEPIIEAVKAQHSSGLSARYRQTLDDRSVDPWVRARLEELRGCVDDITKQVEDPKGRIDTYLTGYRQLRVRFASLVSRMSHNLDVGDDLEGELPPER